GMQSRKPMRCSIFTSPLLTVPRVRMRMRPANDLPRVRSLRDRPSRHLCGAGNPQPCSRNRVDQLSLPKNSEAPPAWSVYKVGMRVECVKDSWRKGPLLTFRRWLTCLLFGLPVKGGVYTISDLGVHRPTGEPALCLK